MLNLTTYDLKQSKEDQIKEGACLEETASIFIIKEWSIFYSLNSDSMSTKAFVSLEATSATLSPPSGGRKGSFSSNAHISEYCQWQQKKSTQENLCSNTYLRLQHLKGKKMINWS